MSFSVRILPSNHIYIVEPQETLLEGALRSGIHLNYSCGSGSCGDCKARLLEGSIGQIDFHDYTIPEHEKCNGKMLLCRAHAASDLIIEASEANSPGDIPHQSIATRVSKIERLGDSRLLIHLRTPRSKTLRFMAGQHVMLRLANGMAKDVPIASCPCNGMVLQFYLHNRGNDPFIRYAFNELVKSERIRVEGPFGNFVLDDESTRPLIMIAFDGGLAPLKSLIEHAINLELSQRVLLYWLVSEEDGHYLDNYCRSWKEVLDDYSYIPLWLPAEMPTEKGEEEGLRVIVKEIRDEVLELQECDLYLAGTEVFISFYRAFFADEGVPESRIFSAQMRREDRG